jgi:hypothetical protein
VRTMKISTRGGVQAATRVWPPCWKPPVSERKHCGYGSHYVRPFLPKPVIAWVTVPKTQSSACRRVANSAQQRESSVGHRVTKIWSRRPPAAAWLPLSGVAHTRRAVASADGTLYDKGLTGKETSYGFSGQDNKSE